MVNINKHIEFWKSGSIEALDYAKETLKAGRYAFAMFFAHLALEKIIKAHVTKTTEDIPPRSHNLNRLLKITGIEIDVKDYDFLEVMSGYSEMGRYPEFPKSTLSKQKADHYMKESERVFEWLKNRL